MPYLRTSDLPDGWKVIDQLHIVLEKDDQEQFIASDNVEGMCYYGVGDTLAEAMKDYGLALTEEFEMYESYAAKGGDYTYEGERLATLKRYIARIA
jgi:hypothetical protein